MTAKPVLALFNNEDDDESLPPSVAESDFGENCIVIRGKLEQELAQMTEAEAEDFLSEFNIPESATDRVIKQSFKLLNLITFFTASEKELHAWTADAGASAPEAAGRIHTDMQRGFIRAEIVSYADLIEAGDFQNAKKKGAVRLEGKNYIVADGDIVHFRFNI